MFDRVLRRRKLDSAQAIRWLKVGLRLRPMISRADALRDAGRHREAADAYEQALRVAPWHAGLKVQCGNMLKDIGRIDDALKWYEAAIADRPEDAEIHLQKGHALKLAGRRTGALAAYRRVLAIDPTNRHASWEMIQAGEADEQARGIVAQAAGHGLETMLTMAAEVEAMRRKLAEIAAELPDVASFTAFPKAAYSLFRQIYDVPPPPADSIVDGRPMLIVADASGLDAEGLHGLLSSILGQSFKNWRAIVIGVDAGLAIAVERVARADPRLQLASSAAGGGGAAIRLAREAAADFAVLPAPGARLHPHCLAWFAAGFAASEAAILTCDEEWRQAGERDPTGFDARGCHDPEMLLQGNVWGDTVAIRGSALASLDLADGGTTSSSNRTDPALADGSFAISDLLLTATRAQLSLGHVPFPLVSFEADDATRDDKGRAARSGHRRAVERHLRELGLTERVELSGGTLEERLRLRWLPDSTGRSITVIVPTRDNAGDCQAFVESLFEKASRPETVDCLIIDNGTRSQPDLDRLEALAARPRVRVKRDDGPFNWSHINNAGARASDAAILVFANDDMAMLTAGWDETLRGLLARDHVGAVGAKLLYPDDTVQHAGILFGWKGSVIHDGLYEPADAGGPSDRWQKTRQVSAVTGAFLAIRRQDFAALGGFDAAQLPIGYSDVDFCLKLREAGRAILFTPDIALHHHESKSRGLDHLDAERAARSRAERRVIETRWGRALFSRDFTLSPLWVDATLPFRLISFPSPERGVQFLHCSATIGRVRRAGETTVSCEYPPDV
ncbi:tetratricopeptide repeat protein [Jiella endophytica]|uniref:Tetratricopeptide repeat protein n=1 Tax=Jiella endophytica TaxID=2558362 RepID=A0A4Y8RQV7_9HYPH|nr:tetratricopeptide repeat protein [Jiella endophytica]